jgi:hypothetical protein
MIATTIGLVCVVLSAVGLLVCRLLAIRLGILRRRRRKICDADPQIVARTPGGRPSVHLAVRRCFHRPERRPPSANSTLGVLRHELNAGRVLATAS